MNLNLIGRPGLLKDLNNRAVFELIAKEGPQSRVGISDKLQLSRPSVSRIVEGLLQSALVEEGDTIASKAGRRQVLLDINPHAGTVVGIDLRVSKVRLMISDLRGRPLGRIEESTNLHDLSDLLEQIVRLVRQATKKIKTAGPLVALTVGVSAAWNPHLEQLYSAPNLPLLENVNLLQHLRSLLKDDCVISVDNDINFAALGEYANGAVKGCPNFFYLNLGSGIGGGVVVDGRLHRGVQGFAGELGTLPIFMEGQFVRLEQVVAHQALSQRVRERGLATDIWDFLANFNDENPLSEDFAREAGTYVALGLGAVIAVLNPALIVIGGGLGRRFDALMPYMITALSEFMPVYPPIVTTALGNDASLMGAISQGIERAREFLLIKELA